MKTVFFGICLALAGCVTVQRVPTSEGDVLFEYPRGPYTNLGLIDVDYYRPGFSAPTLTDAIPKVREQAHAMGGNAFIIRNHYVGEWNRSIIVSAEVLRTP